MSFGAIFFILWILILTICIIFEILLRIEYYDNYDFWVQDGKPFGLLSSSKESKGLFFPKFGSQMAANKLFLLWIFVTPVWIKENKRNLVLIRVFRFLLLVTTIGWFLFLGKLKK